MLSVKLFAKARDLVGAGEVQIPWLDGNTVCILKEQLALSFPPIRGLIPQLLVAVNNSYAQDDDQLTSTDEVACFPAVSGG